MAIAFTGEHASSGPQPHIVVPSKSFIHDLQMYLYACSRVTKDIALGAGPLSFPTLVPDTQCVCS